MTDRHVLLIFMDGIGLGDADPTHNPFAVADTPTLIELAGGNRWLNSTSRSSGARASFVPTDAQLGMAGKPQSASGQAMILTGQNVPQMIGEHYGPRPNPAIREILAADNVFKQVAATGKPVALLEAYPPAFHAAVDRGKRLLSSYQQAVVEAGVTLFDESHVYSGDALTVDWTGEAWRAQLDYDDTPVYTPHDAGVRMVELSQRYAFSMFPHWLSDTVGHRGALQDAVDLLVLFDRVMAGVMDAWRDDEGIVIITSDHGNMEDLSHTKHTENCVPTVVIGENHAEIAADIHSLMDITPAILRYLSI